MIVKEGTTLRGLQPAMQLANCAAELVWNRHGKECVITAGVEFGHSRGSKHPDGDACDYRTRYFRDQAEKERVRNELAQALGTDYDVVLESDHIHCEYDPR